MTRVRPMTPLRAWLATAGLFFAATPYAPAASDLLAGRLYTVPERAYVSQPFELRFELEVSPGCEVEDLRIADFPNDPNVLALGRLETTSRTRVTRDGQPVDVLLFSASGRAHIPVERTFNPQLQCTLVQRRSAGFFSQWQSFPRQLRLAPFSLHILPLPDAGRPANFSGAVGAFRLSGSLSRTVARPGDIITLTLDLTGGGWLGDARIPAPNAGDGFKAYPPKETLREPLHLRTEQVLIPQSTNASEVAAVAFSYFNPDTASYQTCAAGPFPLTLTTERDATSAAEVRVINTSLPAASVQASAVATADELNQRLRRLAPLLIFSVGALIALFVVLQLFSKHPRSAVLFGLLLLVVAGVAGQTISARALKGQRLISRRAEAYFAPSATSPVLFVLAPHAVVLPLETSGTWVRVDASGRRGWISASLLDNTKAPPAAQ